MQGKYARILYYKGETLLSFLLFSKELFERPFYDLSRLERCLENGGLVELNIDGNPFPDSQSQCGVLHSESTVYVDAVY